VLVCTGGGGGGGQKTACGQRGLPERGHRTAPLFLRAVNFDPAGPEHWQCDADDDAALARSLLPPHNSYTFHGSYYHAYVKVASCDTPRGTSSLLVLSRTTGHLPPGQYTAPSENYHLGLLLLVKLRN